MRISDWSADVCSSDLPGVLDRADHVVTAVDDDAGDVGDLAGVAQQLVVELEEAAVDEVVVLDPRERQRETRVCVAVGEVRVDVHDAGGAFPPAPRASRGGPRGFVAAGQN